MARRTNVALADEAGKAKFPVTDGELAMINLQAQVEGQEQQIMAGCAPAVSGEAELIEMIALRGQVLGRIRDYEEAEQRAEQLTRGAPSHAVAFLTRAQARSRFHRFIDALADLDKAQQLGMDLGIIDTERASIFHAIGRYEPAFAIYNEAVKRRPDFASLGALATLRAERGEIAAAEQLFDESRDQYRRVSPIPLALLDFQRGLMWLTHGNLRQAYTWFEAAVRLLPGYAPAQGHLAEVEAAVGEPEAAIARLLPLTTSSDDPDYAASLARILIEADRVEEARNWRDMAAARYDELMARHPQAFADHAAEFWLEAGADPHRALRCARLNFEVRQTTRSRELFARAASATGEPASAAAGVLGDVQASYGSRS